MSDVMVGLVSRVNEDRGIDGDRREGEEEQECPQVAPRWL